MKLVDRSTNNEYKVPIHNFMQMLKINAKQSRATYNQDESWNGFDYNIRLQKI